VPRHTPLTQTEREPLCDLLAQFAAYTDPKHPKKAVWVSRGTPIPAWPGMGRMYTFQAGYLWASALDAEELRADESEETLAELLGYLEPKSLIRSQPATWWPVIQARDADGCVVFEAITSWGRAGEAMRDAARYGNVHVLTMPEVLDRRRRLIAKEEANAKGIEGRPG